jgi:Tannase and feruloyl esterase
LSRFKSRGGKMMIYQGGSDSSVSIKDTLRWYDAMNVNMGSNAQAFARFFVVPGMNHCSGGPATDSFDMLPQLVNWVENGVAPDSVVATASTPGYFGVAARTRPLCPYPKQSRYKGSGDINDASNFTCQ